MNNLTEIEHYDSKCVYIYVIMSKLYIQLK